MSNFKILVVDDYEPFRRFVSSTLEQRAGLQIIDQASDGLEAVQKAESQQPDLVLLDIGFPTLNGIEVAKRVRKLSPATKILILSQHSSPDVVREALRSGATGYVYKSRAGSDLMPAIEAVLRGGRFVSREVAEVPPSVRRMHYSFDFDPTHRIFRFSLNGRITDELMRDFYYGMREPSDRTQSNAGVLDTSAVDSFEVSHEVIAELASASPIVPRPDFLRVVIAPSPEVYGLMRMFAIRGEATRPNSHVVRDEADAWAILGVLNPLFEPLDMDQCGRTVPRSKLNLPD
jgi:CheY-like chemotaxis protein